MPALLIRQRQPVTVPCGWHRGINALETHAQPRVPEPAQLYHLAVLAFLLHVPNDDGDALATACTSCQEPWPCEHLRLAFRIREGF